MRPIIDVSYFQDPNLLVQGAPIDGIIARGSYGYRKKDPQFLAWQKRTFAEGLPFGAYHFYRQTQLWSTQLQVFLEQLESVDYGPGNIYPTLDLEGNSQHGDGKPIAKKFNHDARAIAEELRDRYGKCILYMSSFFPEWMGAPKGNDWLWILEDGYLHWLADYSSSKGLTPPGEPRTPYHEDWHLHQFMPRRHPEIHPANKLDVNQPAPGGNLEDFLIPFAVDGQEPKAEDVCLAERPGGSFVDDDRWNDGWDRLSSGLEMAAQAAQKLKGAVD